MCPETSEHTIVSPKEKVIDLSFRCPDGATLMARVWKPTEGSGPWPTLLMRQPYGRAIASTVTYAHPRWWADQGFLVIIQDVRGQGESTGVFSGFAQEASDTAATLTWVRGLPECSGRIGLYGFSYQGFTQLVADGETPPPDCLAPAMTGLDEREHWSCEGGAHWWHLGLGWGLQLAALQAQRRNDGQAWSEIRRCLEENRHCRDGLELLRKHDPKGMARRWLETSPEEDQAWICHRPSARWLRQPMLLIGGWWDPHLRGVLDLFERSLKAGGTPELHIGPATHLQWWPEAQALHLDFFRRHLMDDASSSGEGTLQPNRKPSPINLWDQRENHWHTYPDTIESKSAWRLMGTALACHDPSEGVLMPLEPEEDRISAGDASASTKGHVVIVHDPWRPVPAVGGHLSPTPGAVDRASVDLRTDVATFTSAPLKSDFQLHGRPVLQLQAKADQAGFDLCAALSVCPEGSGEVQQLSTGVCRVIGEQASTMQTYRVELQAVEARLKTGDRLRVSIAGACWPAIAINPGHNEAPCSAPNSDCRVISINLDSERSTLHLEPLLQTPRISAL